MAVMISKERFATLLFTRDVLHFICKCQLNAIEQGCSNVLWQVSETDHQWAAIFVVYGKSFSISSLANRQQEVMRKRTLRRLLSAV